jgi:Bifunctional DNA primase/polymerase, N-terminal
MRAAANNGSDIDLDVRPLLDAGMDLALAGIPVLPCHWPVEAGPAVDGWTRLACSCGRAECPAPARHVIDGMRISDASTDPVLVARWWTGGLHDANVATVAGAAFGVVELRYSARPAEVRAWLAARQVLPGPVLDAGIGRTQFLTAVGPPKSRFAPLGSTGGVRRLAHGALVLLPPSRLTDRHRVTWLQGPHGVALPDPEQLFAALARLPVDALDLAAWIQARADVA